MAVQKTTFTFRSVSKAGVDLNCFQWKDDCKEPVGIVMITHGLSENVEMFEQQALFLAEHGYVCAGMDFLGHGTTVGEGCVGIAPSDANTAIFEDMFQLYGILKEKYPGLPMYSFSHSMGSMMIRAFLAMYGDRVDIKACFLTGDSVLPEVFRWIIPFAHVLGNWLSPYPKALEKRRAVFVKKDYGNDPPKLRKLMLFWLSFDQQNIINYINSPYSGGANADFRNVFGFAMKAIEMFTLADKKGWAEKIPDNTVIHHGCGQWDIPGFLGLGPRIIHRNLKKAGKKTELHLYFRSMHEVHAESGIREQFHNDMLTLFETNR